MYYVSDDTKQISALTIRQALYYANELGDECTITLPDGCQLTYSGPQKDMTCKLPTAISVATSYQASLIFMHWFEAVQFGALNLDNQPQMRNLYEHLQNTRNRKRNNDNG